MMTDELRICYWCGEAYQPINVGQRCCKKSHATRLNKERRHHTKMQLKPCPHPNKIPLWTRGLAIHKGRELAQRWYFCQCGVYHLTTKEYAK